MMRSSENDWKYRGVFLSPLDYDLALSYAELARLKKEADKSLSQEEIRACERLKKLEVLGGIRKCSCSLSDFNTFIESLPEAKVTQTT